ncbi:MAG: phosphoribosylformylglycinamidine synthase subunit PurS [Candidatus Omnitrophota bacterium]
MLKAEIYITLKKTVVDPQGLVIKHALESLGFSGLAGIRYGKIVSLELDLKDTKIAERQIEQMCKKLLANPIIEDYRFKIKKI